MRTINQLRQRIKQIKSEISMLGDIRVGSLSTQKRSWGGDYLQLSYTYKGKGHTRYVRPEDKDRICQQIDNYKRLKELTAEWLELSMQIIDRDDAKTTTNH